MKIYLAGRMSGIPKFNFPRFDEAADDLRAKGYDVVSPAELDDPETRAAAMASPDGSHGSGSPKGQTWGDFLARDLKLIADGGVEGIICLEEWWKSKGARVETFNARILGLPIFKYADLKTVSYEEIELAHHVPVNDEEFPRLGYQRAA